MSDILIKGGCLCGQVRYAVTGAPQGVEYCHCSMCRKQGGAPVGGWIDVSLGAFTWVQGAPREYASSPEARRGFCENCGSPLSFRWLKSREKISLTIGSLDDPGRFPPTQHIYHADKIPWLHLKDDLPRHAGSAANSGPDED